MNTVGGLPNKRTHRMPEAIIHTWTMYVNGNLWKKWVIMANPYCKIGYIRNRKAADLWIEKHFAKD